MDIKEHDKRKIKDFKKLKKEDLIEIIYQLESMTLASKSKIIELERIIEERGNLIESLKDVIEDNHNLTQNYQYIIGQMKEEQPTGEPKESAKEVKVNSREKKKEKLFEKIDSEKTHTFVESVEKYNNVNGGNYGKKKELFEKIDWGDDL